MGRGVHLLLGFWWPLMVSYPPAGMSTAVCWAEDAQGPPGVGLVPPAPMHGLALGKCNCCCGSAVWARAGDCATVHSDGGPGAGCSEVCCDEANVSQVSSLVRTLPMFRTAQTSTASKQMTDLHRSLGTPQGWTTVQRGWSPPRCCAAGEEMRIPDANGSDCALPQYTSILFYSILFH